MARVRVLCVDDEPAIRLMIPALLEPHGYEVTASATVADALAQITTREFDVLISDLNVGHPGDGFTVMSAMRRTQPDCVNLILTGFPALETALQAIRSQVDDYLLKPVDVPHVIATIEDRLKSRREHREEPLPSKRISRLIDEHSTDIIRRTLLAMKADRELAELPISDQDRTRQMPYVLRELVLLLASEERRVTRDEIKVVGWRGEERFREGYTIPMLATSICLLERTIYDVINENLLVVNMSYLLTDLRRLHESLAVQLGESLRAYLRVEGHVA